MTTRIELFVAVVDGVAKPVNQTAGAAAIHGQFNTHQKGFSLVVQTTQTASAIASVLSVSQLTTGAVPFINIVTNTLAGSVTFLKIVAEYKSDATFNTGDLVTLTGNAAGVIASFAILAGAPYAGAAFTAVAVATALAGIYDSSLAKAIHNKIAPIFPNIYNYDSTGVHDTPFIAPDLTLAPANAIMLNHQSLIATVNWNPDTSEVTLGTRILRPLDDTTLMGPSGGSSSSVPSFRPTISPDGASITMIIESLNGVKSPDPAPSLTTPIDEKQDSYACCNGAQQDQYF